jgi:ABC-type sugar transport system ATPase subunit
MADRIVVLRHGRVTGQRPVRSATPVEIVSLNTGELADEAPAERRSWAGRGRNPR